MSNQQNDEQEDTEIVKLDNTTPNTIVQKNKRDRAKGGIYTAVRMLAIFLFFRQEDKLPPEIIPYFQDFIKTRPAEANYFMDYYDKSVQHEVDRLRGLEVDFTPEEVEEDEEEESQDQDDYDDYDYLEDDE